jgi:hypothetical protein
MKKTAGKKKRLREILLKFSSEEMDYGISIDQAIKEIQELSCDCHIIRDSAVRRVEEQQKIIAELEAKLSTPLLTATREQLIGFFESLSELGLITFTQTMQPRDLADKLLDKVEPRLMDWEKVLPQRLPHPSPKQGNYSIYEAEKVTVYNQAISDCLSALKSMSEPSQERNDNAKV